MDGVLWTIRNSVPRLKADLVLFRIDVEGFM